MQKPIALITLALLALATAARAATPPLIPFPTQYQPHDGTFTFSAPTLLASKDLLPLAQNFAAPLHLRIINRDTNSSIAGPTLTLALHPDPQKNPESYTLDITPNEISISAPTPAGAFYALQTLRQLFPTDLEAPLPYASAPNATPLTEPPPPPEPAVDAEGNLLPSPALHPVRPGRSLPETPYFALKNPDNLKPFPIPCCHIEDAPHYPWRGILLDCSRHFFPKPYILRYIDTLALHKMNILHWHLTDDQGWRIEILQYPKLTQISAFRSRAEPLPAGPRGAAATAASQPATPEPDEHYGGFYTQDDIREIVAYAQSRFITIVPEIEMPGHSTAVLAAYPELACTDAGPGAAGPFHVATRWGVFTDIYCPNDQTFTFLQNVLDEVCDLFPSPYIHIGGDEVPKDRWKASPESQRIIHDNNLKDENELQAYFVQRMGNYLVNEKHKRFIGWDEILEGGLAPGAIVESWRGTAGGIAAASSGHDVVMSPQSHCYFDHPSEPDDKNPKRGTSAVSLDKVYNFNPTPDGLTPEQAKHILGAEGTLWSERIPTPDRADYMTYPRTCALAEALWTAPPFTNGSRDYANFSARLAAHFQQMKSLDIAYFDDPTAHATVIAAWQPNDFQKSPTTHNYDLTAQLIQKSPTTLQIRFNLTNGKEKLDISSITLTENEKQIAADTHPATAGTSSKATLYTLPLPSINPTAKYTLHITATAGPDTTGNILLLNE